ncbi:YpiB family protein [Mammaliicoccus fleurettii]|uniref:YpiB family protein n=1 Tax=Mammaliicoccus fleurettii TaxID=150056 RepID=UPI000E03F465|nr:YpiB family protein [Mammaliicoccus fleurettii]RTX88142.1 IDEAL domain-containing protein [Mammaliicoccus fleurettii]SUM36653.1 Putative cytosolic protein [Mammaliicoccus fleurettii]HCN59721.1 hypothetical protein [Staphylococcus sp.]
MNHTWLNYEKQRFIEYILYQYDFKIAESVWILNLLKSSPKYLSNITFVSELSNNRILSISTSQSKQLPLLYCKDQFCIENGRQIFHDIRLDNTELNVLLYLNKNDDRLNRLLILQMLVDYYGEDKDIRSFNNNNNSLHHWGQLIRNEIDKSLDNNDQDTFLEMSKILQFINELEEHQ